MVLVFVGSAASVRVTVPSLFVELTGDQACFPEDAAAMFGALGADDKTFARIAGTHLGGPIAEGRTNRREPGR